MGCGSCKTEVAAILHAAIKMESNELVNIEA
jgi:NAD(P)H-nitrite reductase large subunit